MSNRYDDDDYFGLDSNYGRLLCDPAVTERERVAAFDALRVALEGTQAERSARSDPRFEENLRRLIAATTSRGRFATGLASLYDELSDRPTPISGGSLGIGWSDEPEIPLALRKRLWGAEIAFSAAMKEAAWAHVHRRALEARGADVEALSLRIDSFYHWASGYSTNLNNWRNARARQKLRGRFPDALRDE